MVSRIDPGNMCNGTPLAGSISGAGCWVEWGRVGLQLCVLVLCVWEGAGELEERERAECSVIGTMGVWKPG